MARLHRSKKIVKYGKSAPKAKGQLNIEGRNSTAPHSAQSALQFLEQTLIKYYATLESFEVYPISLISCIFYDTNINTQLKDKKSFPVMIKKLQTFVKY